MKLNDMVCDVAKLKEKSLYKAIDEVVDAIKSNDHGRMNVSYFILNRFLLDLFGELEVLDRKEECIYLGQKLMEAEVHISGKTI